jgi:hypothetical protein
MNYPVTFVFKDKNREREETRYMTRVPNAGEYVSFPNTPGSVPPYVAFKVLRVHTFLDFQEHEFSVELE